MLACFIFNIYIFFGVPSSWYKPKRTVHIIMELINYYFYLNLFNILIMSNNFIAIAFVGIAFTIIYSD